jgi:hypothetical protein
MIFESTVFNFRWVLFKNNCYIFTKTTMKTNIAACIATILLLMACSTPYKPEETISTTFHQDVPFMQDYSIKYYSARKDAILQKAFADRNGIIQVLSQDGLLKTHGGRLLYPGKLIDDRTHRPLTDKQINDLTIIDQQFVYLGDEAVFSNAWAGKLFVPHSLPNARVFDGSPTLLFLVSDGYEIHFLTQKDPPRQYQSADGKVLDIRYDLDTKNFWILAENAVFKFDPKTMELEKHFEGLGFTAFAIAKGQVIVGTDKGYLTFDQSTGKPVGDKQSKLPWPEITAIEIIDGNCWFGSTRGAFMINDKGTINYYNGERWLPGNRVLHLSEGNDSTILILTDRGLGQIVMEEMTLEEKASYFENQVRRRHIRYGFNAGLVDMEKGNVDSGRLQDSDNDGLWTAMYLASQVFRYKVTGSEDALMNCQESFDAMERLYSINPVRGFPSRSFARSGYIDRLGNPERWQHSSDPEWDWKATTSSDEAIGHIFAFGVMAELLDSGDLKTRAIALIDTLMGHIVKNDLYMVDYDGKPTTWGRWNPDYVNARPKMVGDRKLNSSNIIAMLQTGFHFTGNEKYRTKAFDLMENHGYLENLMRPMGEIGPAPPDSDEWSKMLSESWNHSDDEMYFLGYWGLYRYAFNDSLRVAYKKAILDHWQTERPEKEGAWNIMTAMTGTNNFDLHEAVWYLQQHPMDLIDWPISNSHRKDLLFIDPNFRNQTTATVLPPDERPVQRHNSNMFTLDRNRGNGRSEYSAGDIWLLPYWMGRYLGVISAADD